MLFETGKNNESLLLVHLRRVGGRRVEVVDPRRLLAEIETLPASEERGGADDWVGYFSDPKNRNIF